MSSARVPSRPLATASSVPSAQPLTPTELVDYTRFLAGEIRQDRYPFIRFDPEVRWHRRIYRDPRVDVWLIGWSPTQGTELHDHGGSAGAYTVVSGELAEATYVEHGPRAGTLRERTLRSRRSVGFDARYIHDVRNLSDEPAVSVHAYSPPLTTMSYYEVDGGRITRIATISTDDPEPDDADRPHDAR